jgi:drug/metabolite transporter (DMT)-like permease
MDAVPARGDRVAHLERQAEAAQVRADRLPLVVTLIIVALLLLTIAVAMGDRLPARWRPAVRPLAFGALGLVPGTFLAAAVPATRTSGLAFAVVVVGVAAVVAAASTLVERRRPGVGGLVAVGSVLVLVAVDLLVGAPLQVNSIFGYSMAVAGRFTGLGNLAFALFASAGVCFAVLAHDRFGARAQPWIAASLVAIVLFEGLPMLGADVGGVLSVVPAFALTYLALRGRRIGWREVIGCGLAAVAVVAVLGLLDSSQSASSQTHLARVGQSLAAGRLDAVATIVWRRIHASFGGSTLLVWLLCLSLVGAALVQAGAVARNLVGPGAPQRSRTPEGIALAIGLGSLALVGLVVNDSSVAVPTTMLIVIVPVLILRRTAPAAARARDLAPGSPS